MSSKISREQLNLIKQDQYVKFIESSVPVVRIQDPAVLREIYEKVENGELISAKCLISQNRKL